VAIDYARFAEHVLGDIEQARDIYRNETRTTGSVLELWLSWLHFELQHRTGVERETAVAQICDSGLKAEDLPISDRIDLSRAWLEVAQCCGTDIARERQIARDLLLLTAQSATVTKKRAADAVDLAESPRPTKQSKVDDAPVQYTAPPANYPDPQYYQNYASYPGYANYYQGGYVNYQ
jgi:hypothetical protein